MIVDIINYLKEKSQMVKYCGYFLIGAIFVWSMTVDTGHHAHTWAEKYIPGFWSLFGLASCAILITIANWLGRSGVSTRENYYDN